MRVAEGFTDLLDNNSPHRSESVPHVCEATATEFAQGKNAEQMRGRLLHPTSCDTQGVDLVNAGMARNNSRRSRPHFSLVFEDTSSGEK